MPADFISPSVPDLQRRVDELAAELREALRREAAVAEILQVTNASGGDLARVFGAMLERATRLCSASYGYIWTYEGETVHPVAVHGDEQFKEWLLQSGPLRPGPKSPLGRALSSRRPVHILDATEEETYRSEARFRDQMDRAGIRTMLHVPLRKEDRLLGVITVYRRERQAFTDQQVRLLESFAEQAVIAMENARLLDEQRDALERQTATAEVLQVINSSPGDLAPVFDAMLEKATRLCEAKFGNLLLYDGQAFTAVADRNLPPAYAQAIAGPIRPGPNTALGRMIRTRAPVHVTDMLEDIAYAEREPLRTSTVELGGVRSMVAIPLLKEGDLIGAFTIYRREAGGFAENQIALVSAFADQAVIAIENTRLLAEQHEALERQTATAEILQVINSSPGDLTPVFEAILEKAHALCQVAYGSLQLYDGTNFRAVAVHSLPEPLANRLREGYKPGPNHPVNSLLDGEDFVHVRDFAEIDDPIARSAVEAGGIRTALFVALRNDRKLFGMIVAARRQVWPFAAKETALLQSFAAQAVIAIENARLINETREALEQQTATADVLQVINSSPGDLAPVFDMMLQKAMTLCGAAFGFLTSYDGQRFTPVAMRGVPPPLADYFTRGMDQPRPGEAHFRILEGEDVIHNLDQKDEEAYRAGLALRRAVVDLGGARTALVVALRKDDAVLGALTFYRKEVRPFSDKQIALIRSFAAQAVIAIENVRLFTELRQRTDDLQESLEYQTAASEVLEVIGRSTSDIQPVLDAMLSAALRLCRTESGGIAIQQGQGFRYVATLGWDPEADRIFRSLDITAGRGTVAARVIADGRIVQVADVASDPEFALPDMAELSHWHTALGVPLMREGRPIGVIAITRDRVEPFTERQIALVKTFADQAVIAMENARLLGELRQRTDDLTQSLEYQTATSDVLKVISRSTFDLQPVLDTLSATAAQLCAAELSFMTRREGDAFRFVTAVGATPETTRDAIRLKQEVLDRHLFRPGRDTITGRVVAEGGVVQIVDVASDAEYALTDLTTVGKIKTLLGVPLMREGEVIGTMSLARQRIEPFTDKQIELIRTFADQAVIAMENARLLGELTRREQELSVTFEHMGDGVAMFDAEPRLAAWNRNFEEIIGLPEVLLSERPSYADYLRMLAERGEFGTENVEAELASRLEDTDRELRLERTRADGTVIEVRRNAVPGGGFVLIYSDVTEQRRAEAADPRCARRRRGGAGAADGHGRHPEGHRQFADRCSARAGCRCEGRTALLWCRGRSHLSSRGP